MSFIYTNTEVKEDTPQVTIPVSSTTEESKFRNDNLKALEISKLKEGQASLKSSLEEVGFDDAMALFNLEKISKED